MNLPFPDGVNRVLLMRQTHPKLQQQNLCEIELGIETNCNTGESLYLAGIIQVQVQDHPAPANKTGMSVTYLRVNQSETNSTGKEPEIVKMLIPK